MSVKHSVFSRFTAGITSLMLVISMLFDWGAITVFADSETSFVTARAAVYDALALSDTDDTSDLSDAISSEGYIGIGVCNVKKGSSDLKNVKTLKNGDKISFEFDWQMMRNGTELGAIYKVDLTEYFHNVRISPFEPIHAQDCDYLLKEEDGRQYLYIITHQGQNHQSGGCMLDCVVEVNEEEEEDLSNVELKFIDEVYTVDMTEKPALSLSKKAVGKPEKDGDSYWQEFNITLEARDADLLNTVVADTVSTPPYTGKYKDFKIEPEDPAGVTELPKEPGQLFGLKISKIAKGEKVTITYKAELSNIVGIIDSEEKSSYKNTVTATPENADPKTVTASPSVEPPKVNSKGANLNETDKTIEYTVKFNLNDSELLGIENNQIWFTDTITDNKNIIDESRYNEFAYPSEIKSLLEGKSVSLPELLAMTGNDCGSISEDNGVYILKYKIPVKDNTSYETITVTNDIEMTPPEDPPIDFPSTNGSVNTDIPGIIGELGKYYTIDQETGKVYYSLLIDIPKDTTGLKNIDVYDWFDSYNINDYINFGSSGQQEVQVSLRAYDESVRSKLLDYFNSNGVAPRPSAKINFVDKNYSVDGVDCEGKEYFITFWTFNLNTGNSRSQSYPQFTVEGYASKYGVNCNLWNSESGKLYNGGILELVYSVDFAKFPLNIQNSAKITYHFTDPSNEVTKNATRSVAGSINYNVMKSANPLTVSGYYSDFEYTPKQVSYYNSLYTVDPTENTGMGYWPLDKFIENEYQTYIYDEENGDFKRGYENSEKCLYNIVKNINSSYDSTKENKYNSKNGEPYFNIWTVKIKTKIRGNIDGSYDNAGAIRIIDTLPPGLELANGVPILIHGEYVNQRGSQNYIEELNPEISSRSDGSTQFTINITEDDIKKINTYGGFPAIKNTTLFITYVTRVNDEGIKLLNSGQTTFRNTAEAYPVAGGNGGGNYASLTITPKYYIEKSGLGSVTYDETDKCYYQKYQVTLNKNSTTINNGNPYTLTDTYGSALHYVETKGKVAGSQITVTPPDGVIVTPNEEAHTITFGNLQDKTQYTITYRLKLDVVGINDDVDETNYQNSISGEINGTTISSEPMKINSSQYKMKGWYIYDKDDTYITLEGTKIWKIAAGGKVPESIDIQVIKIETDKEGSEELNQEIINYNVKLTEDPKGVYKYMIENLVTKTSEGSEEKYYKYKVKEITDGDFTVQYNTDVKPDADGYISLDKLTETDETIAVLNMTNIETTKVTVNKKWNDGDYEDRPLEIEVTLKVGETPVEKDADGVEITSTVHLNSDCDWTYTWENLPKFTDAGEEIVYTVDEVSVDGYQSDKVNTGNEYTITNTKTTNIKVIKDWEDEKNTYNTRPESITVQLKQNDVVYSEDGEVKLNAANNWKHEWTDLPQYDEDGNKYTYEVDEVGNIANYTNTGITEENNIFTITNTLNNQEVKFTKTWVDSGNAYLTRPDEITVELEYWNGEKWVSYGEETVSTQTGDVWTATWNDLPAGVKFRVKEESVNKYTSSASDGIEVSDDGTVGITNTLTDETSITVVKKWVDHDNTYNTRPESITVRLKQNDDVYDSFELNAANNWSHKREKLPQYDTAGKKYTYTVDEIGNITNYTKTGITEKDNIFTITNTLDNQEVKFTKTWVDNGNAYLTRPEGITVVLEYWDGEDWASYGEKTVSTQTGDVWTATWNDLPAGVKFRVKEKEVDKYTSSASIGTAVSDDGTVGITNTLTENTSVTVTKKWDDEDNRYNTRPENLSVTLTSSEPENNPDTVVLNADNKWTYKWTGLPKYNKDGELITYTVTESLPDNYTAADGKDKISTTADNYEITLENKLNRTTSVSIEKLWDDEDNKYNTRPAAIKVQLYYSVPDGEGTIREPYGLPVSISADTDGNWGYTWNDLPDGAEYKAEEFADMYIGDEKFVNDINGKPNYTVSESETEDNKKFTVTNTLHSKEVTVNKKDIAQDKEVQGATLTLYYIDENGEEKQVESWVTDGTEHQLKGLVTGRKYILSETIDENSEANSTVEKTITTDIHFSIDKDGNVTIDSDNSWNEKELEGDVLVNDNQIIVNDSLYKTVTVNKMDVAHSAEVIGAELEVYYVDEYGIEQSVDKWTTTAEEQTHEVSGLATGKTYYLRETNTPNGYKTATVTEFSVDKAGNVTANGEDANVDENNILIINDTLYRSLTINKKDIFMDEEIEGAKLQVFVKNEDGSETPAADSKGDLLEWTSVTGEVWNITDLVPGVTYVLRETYAPENVEFSLETDIEFTVDEDGNVSIVETEAVAGEDYTFENGLLVVNDTLYKTVTVNKMDVAHSAEVIGAELEVYYIDESGIEQSVDKWTTTAEEQKHEITGLETGKTYYLRETITPDGYKTASVTEFSVDKYGVVTAAGTDVTTDGANGMIINDTLLGTFTINKMDIARNVEVNGAVLTIYDESGNVATDKYGNALTWTSKTGEQWYIEGLVPNTVYTLKEDLSALPEMVESGISTDISFTLDHDGNVTILSGSESDYRVENNILIVNNTLKGGSVYVDKKDAATGKSIAGATLGLYDSEDNVIYTWTSSETSEALTGLNVGQEYVVKEIFPVNGYYKLNAELRFKIDADGNMNVLSESVAGLSATGNVITVFNSRMPTDHNTQQQGPDKPDGEIVLEKQFEGVDLDSMSKIEREEFLGSTLFTLETILGEKVGAHPVWEDGKAIVRINLMNSRALKRGMTYRLYEISAPDGYERSTTTYMFRIDEKGKTWYSTDNGKNYSSGIPVCLNVNKQVSTKTGTIEEDTTRPVGEEVGAGAGIDADQNKADHTTAMAAAAALIMASIFGASAIIRRRKKTK